MKKIIVIILIITVILCESTLSQTIDKLSLKEVTIETSISGRLIGTLTMPENKTKNTPIALIIAGSGPTDRDGNNSMMKNYSLKLLAEQLALNGIGSVRYDKRGVAGSISAAKSESELRFENYISDAKDWINWIKINNPRSKIIVIGHSEGSLIGMIAAAENADAFVSIAGAGRAIDIVLKEQLGSQPKMIKDISFQIIDSLKIGKMKDSINPMLFSLFRPSVQPYLISWFNYDPQIQIKYLHKPSLIIQGNNDIQVTTEDANLLYKANPKNKLIIIDKMNHIFKLVEGDRKTNVDTYNNPSLPIAPLLVENIVKFIKSKDVMH
jgi:alpha/beta superfamily hydrolase